jgi:PKD repeat protein
MRVVVVAVALALVACGGRVIEDRNNVVPTASAGGDRTASPGEELVFDGSASRDADGEIVSYLWTFPDGDVEGVTVTRAFDDEGAYVVSLEVTDDLGGKARAEILVTVEVGAPRAAATASTLTPSIGDVVSFDASATEADAPIASYTWRFGDGSPSVTGVEATHTFTASGPKTVTLTVEDEAGRRGTAQIDLVVTGVDVTGVYDLVVDPSTFGCAEYTASWTETELTLATTGEEGADGVPIRATTGGGDIFQGFLNGDRLTASTTWVGETGGGCISAPVDGNLTITFDADGHFTALLTAFYDLGVPCQCSALFQMEGTRR